MCCRGFSPFFSISTKRLATIYAWKNRRKNQNLKISATITILCFQGPSRFWPNPTPLVESLSQSPTVSPEQCCLLSCIFFDNTVLQFPIRTLRKFCNLHKPKLVSYISLLKVNTIVQSRHPVIVFNGDPEFELTFEEDFRIHELLVGFFGFFSKNLCEFKVKQPRCEKTMSLTLSTALSLRCPSFMRSKILQYATRQ